MRLHSGVGFTCSVRWHDGQKLDQGIPWMSRVMYACIASEAAGAAGLGSLLLASSLA